jgi:hypothetical protein
MVALANDNQQLLLINKTRLLMNAHLLAEVALRKKKRKFLAINIMLIVNLLSFLWIYFFILYSCVVAAATKALLVVVVCKNHNYNYNYKEARHTC